MCILYALIFSILFQVAQNTIKNPGFDFKKVENNAIGIKHLGVNYIAKSLTACAIQCVKLSETCYSFKYNKNNGLCSLGSWLTTASLASSNDDVYWRGGALCNTAAGFSLRKLNNVTYCYRIMLQNVIYMEAKSSCQDQNSILITPRSTEKLQLLSLLVPDIASVWVGLDDIAVEGEFRFADDGSIMSNENIQLVFTDGGPDDYGGAEDCAQYVRYYNKLNDAPCTKYNPYICEVYPSTLI